MGTNFHTAYANVTNKFSAASMNPVPAALDKAITYGTNRPIIHCDGYISWASGSLAWSDDIRIVFNREDGNAIENTIAPASVALSDGEFAYTTLNETDGTVISVSKAAIATATASNFLTLGILVLAVRNTNSDDLFMVNLPVKPLMIHKAGTPFSRREIINFIGDAVTVADDSANHRTNVTIKNGIPEVGTESYAATIEVDLDSYNVVDITLEGDPTINFTGGFDGQQVIIRLKQDATGSRTVTWGTMVRFSGDIPEPTLTTTASALDYLTFIKNSVDESSPVYHIVSVNKDF